MREKEKKKQNTKRYSLFQSKVLRLQSPVRSVRGGTDSRDKLCFSVWRGIWLEMAVWGSHCGSETIKSGGESLYPWQHMFESEQLDPAKPQWLTAQLAVRIISCVSLVCRSLSKSEALLQECRVKICMKWKTKASKERCLWEERKKNTWCYEENFHRWMPFGGFSCCRTALGSRLVVNCMQEGDGWVNRV